MLLPVVFLLAGCKYDDSDVWKKIDDHTARLTALESMCNNVNSDLVSLRSIVEALQNNVYVASVTQTGNGYTITFTDKTTVTITNGTNGTNGKDGTDGKDGSTPEIGVRQDTDGIWYWTLNGNWLTDSAGNKVQATGTDGAAGTPGVTPQLKIEEDYWYVSYDEGKTWTQAGKAVADYAGDEVFAGVTTDESFVYFTLSDGTVIAVPLAAQAAKLQLVFDETVFAKMDAGETVTTTYTLVAPEGVETSVDTYAYEGWTVLVQPADETTGTLSITAPDPMRDGKVMFILTGSDGTSFVKVVTITERPEDDIETAYVLDAAGGEVSIQAKILTAVVDEEAASWLTATVTEEGVVLAVQPNADYSGRTAQITLTTKKEQTVVVTLTQLQKDAIVVSFSQVSITWQAQEVEIAVRANVECSAEVTAGSDWLTPIATKALTTTQYVFQAAENPSETEERTAEVVFTSADGQLSQTVKVVQARKSNEPLKPVKVTVAQFNAAAPSEVLPYQLTGVISNISNASYGNFDLTDDTGTVYVYGLTATDLGYGAENDKSFSSLGLKKGDTVTLTGYRATFTSADGSEKIEVVYAYHVSHVSAPDPTVSDALAAEVGERIALGASTVMAVYQRGFVVSDGSKAILCYVGSNFLSGAVVPSVGDQVTLTGTRETVSNTGMPELSNISGLTVVSSGTAGYPTAKDITNQLDSYSATEAEYVTFTGDLAVSGSYYNITVDGQTNIGSVRYPLESFGFADLGGHNVTVTGYYDGLNSGKYQYVVVTAVKDNGAIVAPGYTVSEVLAMTEAASVSLKESLVVAKSTRGFIVTDGSKYLYVYANTEVGDVSVGDKVTLTGTWSKYYDLIELTSPSNYAVTGTGAVTHPAAIDMTGSMDTFSPLDTDGASPLVQVKGKLSAGSTSYVSVDGAAYRLRVRYLLSTQSLSDFDGKGVIVKGYYLGSNASAGVQDILFVSIEEDPDASGEEPGGETGSTENLDLSTATYKTPTTEDQVVWNATHFTLQVDKADASTVANNYLGGDSNNRTSSRFYKGSRVTITPASGTTIKSMVWEATSTSYATAFATNSTWSNATASASGTTVTVTPTDGSKAVTVAIGGTCGFTKLTVSY